LTLAAHGGNIKRTARKPKPEESTTWARRRSGCLRCTLKATVDEIVKGLAVAQAIFVKAGTDAYGAASAKLQRDRYAEYLDKDGEISEDSMTDEEARVCMVWEEAEEAAIAACCEGWAVKPTSAYLELAEIPAKELHKKSA
jgi:hypothetical protein